MHFFIHPRYTILVKDIARTNSARVEQLMLGSDEALARTP